MGDLPLEKEVEAAFFDFMKLSEETLKVSHLTSVKRQVKLPLGIVDIMGFNEAEYGYPYIIEIKRGKIDRKAVGQLAGYVSQMDDIVRKEIRARIGFSALDIHDEFKTGGCLVGNTIDDDALRAAVSLGYDVYVYYLKNGVITFLEYYLGDYDLGSLCDETALEIARKTIDRWEAFSIYEKRPIVSYDAIAPKESLDLFSNSFRTVYSVNDTEGVS